MWKDMSKEEVTAFRAEHGSLENAALKDALTVLFTEKILKQEDERAGWDAEYLPLSVYKNRGYTQALI